MVKATINRGLSSVAVALPATVNLFCPPRLNISVVVRVRTTIVNVTQALLVLYKGRGL
jgi:hypothetical protein